MNRAELARRADVKPNVLNKYVNRGSEPMAYAIARLARALNVSLDWLLDDAQEWPPGDGNTAEVTVSASSDEELRTELAKRYRRLAVSLYENLNRAEKIDWHKVTQEVQAVKASEDLPKHIQDLERLARSIEQAYHGAQGFGLTAGLMVAYYVPPHPRIKDEDLEEDVLINRFVSIELQLHEFISAIERRKRSKKST